MDYFFNYSGGGGDGSRLGKAGMTLSKTVFPPRFFVIVRCWDQVGNLKNSNWGKPSYVAAQPHPKEDMFFLHFGHVATTWNEHGSPK